MQIFQGGFPIFPKMTRRTHRETDQVLLQSPPVSLSLCTQKLRAWSQPQWTQSSRVERLCWKDPFNFSFFSKQKLKDLFPRRRILEDKDTGLPYNWYRLKLQGTKHLVKFLKCFCSKVKSLWLRDWCCIICSSVVHSGNEGSSSQASNTDLGMILSDAEN